MEIKVNPELKKSMQHDIYKLQNRTGEVVHQLEDGKWLIRFKDLTILKRGNERVELQWYIHKDDLKVL